MPYPNEHSARLKPPGRYQEFRRENNKFGDGIHAIWGILVKGKKRKSELQAIRFSADRWTVAAAKKWLKDHGYKPITFEPAKKSSDGQRQRLHFPRAALYLRTDASDVNVVTLAEPDEHNRPRVRIVAHTGQVINDHPFYGNFAVDLSGLKIRRQRLPILREHDTRQVVGWTERIAVEDGQLVAAGFLSRASEAGREQIALLEDGCPFQASIYVPPQKIERIPEGETAEVNGHTLKGPGTIFRSARLREVSLCAMGADEDTSAELLSANRQQISLDVEVDDRKEKAMADETPVVADDNEETLTAAQLAERYPDQIAELIKQRVNEKLAEATQAAQTAERERILAILAQRSPGEEQDKLARECIEQGLDPKEAALKLKDGALAELRRGAPDNLGPNKDPNVDKDPETKLKERWESDEDLRAEFADDFAAFRAYAQRCGI